MNEIAISTQVHTLAPGRELPIATGGNTFEILSSTGDVEVKLGQGDFNRLPAGLVVGDPDVYFRDLVLRNATDEPNTVEIYVGTGTLRDNRFVAAGQVDVGGPAFDDVVSAVQAGPDWYNINLATVTGVNSVGGIVFTGASNTHGVDLIYAILSTGAGSIASLEKDGSNLVQIEENQNVRLDRLHFPALTGMNFVKNSGANSRVSFAFRRYF